MKFKKLILCLIACFSMSACSFDSSVETKFYLGRQYKLAKVTEVAENETTVESWQTYYNDSANEIDMADKLKSNERVDGTHNYQPYNFLQFTFDGNFIQRFTHFDGTIETYKGTYYEKDTTTLYRIFMKYDNEAFADTIAYDRLLELPGGGGIDPNYIRVKQNIDLGFGEKRDVYLWYYCAIILGDSLKIDKNRLDLQVGQSDTLTLTRVPAIAGLKEPIWTIEQNYVFYPIDGSKEGSVIKLEIDSSGFVAKVTALSTGSADIYARINNDSNYALLLCHVEVK